MSPPPTMPPSPGPDLTAAVTAIFSTWQQHKVIFVVLRNYEQLPQFTGHDIDVLVHPSQLALAEQLLVAAARSTGYHLSNRAEFATVSLFFFHPDTLVQIQIDLFSHLTWRGFTLLAAESVLNWRRDCGLFAIPHPVHEAVNDLLTRQIYHGYVKEKYKPFVHATFKAYPQESETLLRRMFGDTVGRRVAQGVLLQDWPHVEAQTKAMRWQITWRRIVFCSWETGCLFLGGLRRFVRRVHRPPGAKIVLLGADGSGKSTVADRLSESLHGTFYSDKSLRIHWKPAVFLRQRRANRPPTTNPHARPPRGWLLSQLVLAYHWVEFLFGSIFQNLPVLFRAGMVLIERHHYDFIADPRRYRLQPPCGLIRFAFRCLRRPDLVFLLDAPAEVLHARKPEMTLAETHRQREAYRALVAALPNGRIMDGTLPPGQVLKNILREVLVYLEQRQLKRSGK